MGFSAAPVGACKGMSCAVYDPIPAHAHCRAKKRTSTLSLLSSSHQMGPIPDLVYITVILEEIHGSQFL